MTNMNKMTTLNSFLHKHNDPEVIIKFNHSSKSWCARVPKLNICSLGYDIEQLIDDLNFALEYRDHT